jgi:hypothetical protein
MGEALFGLLIIGVIFAVMLITLYGAALVLTENFWLGVVLLILIPPFFFIWAFIRGLSGK